MYYPLSQFHDEKRIEQSNSGDRKILRYNVEHREICSFINMALFDAKDRRCNRSLVACN